MDHQPGPKRSHFGCVRCKKRRQKCDEGRPSCGRCSGASVPCSYSVTLKWGGRIQRRVPTQHSPQASNDGRAVVKTAAELKDPSAEGVAMPLTIPAAGAIRNISIILQASEEHANPAISSISVETPALFPSPYQVAGGIQPWSSLPETVRSSLHYFVHRASHATSAHARIQQRICGIVVPMALETPSLLYATVALSDLHRSTLQHDGHGFDLDKHLSGLIARSLRCLRDELQPGRNTNRYAMLVAIRTLCIFEIHSGRAAPGSWRVHMEGAKALLAASRKASERTDAASGPGEPQWLVERWFASIESFSALTNRGLVNGQLEATPGSMEDPSSPAASSLCAADTDSGHQFVDIYSAYTTSLNNVFKEIGAAAWERRKMSCSPQEGGGSILTEADLDLEASSLETTIRSSLGRSQFDPVMQPSLTADEMDQFAASDDAYRYTALCHLQRHVRRLPRSSPEVQHTVAKIIESVQRIRPAPGLSPWVMATTPLFAAGCAALIPEDRERVRVALRDLYASLRIRNVQRCLDILEMMWEGDPDGDEDFKVPMLHRDWDFIPY
ncbi:fungal-specific transcription factor domain-containing protein [Xylariales sp. PMI_506]|nr:fungal-specific transcription factor domain-containing protein [Xylariales sp. PMI_506]